MQSHFSLIWESVADAVPEHIALIQGERRITWHDYEDRAARLAQGLIDSGLSHNAKVGMYLYNSPEYAETNFAAMKIGGVPINVNYRYLDEELHYNPFYRCCDASYYRMITYQPNDNPQKYFAKLRAWKDAWKPQSIVDKCTEAT